MVQSIISLLEHFIVPLGATGVFLAEVIEEVIVPIPSALILLGSGFLFLKGPVTSEVLSTLFFTIVIPAAFGLTIGSLVVYTVAYKGGKIFIDRYGKWIGVSWKDIEYIDKKFEEGFYDEWSFVIARIFPVIPSVLIAVFCGLTQMPVKKYVSLTFIGAFFKALLLAVIGWQVGELYIEYVHVITRVENFIFAGVALTCVGFVVYRKQKQKML